MKLISLPVLALIAMGNTTLVDSGDHADAQNGPGAFKPSDLDDLLAAHAALQAKKARDFESVQLRTPNFAQPPTVKAVRLKDGVISEVEIDLRRNRRLPWGRSQADCTASTFVSRDGSDRLLLDREPASADEPYLIYAVDRREDNCPVMVMKGNPDDVSPLPEVQDGPPSVIPADDGEP